MLDQQAIDEFKAIYKEEYGKEITDKEAIEIGMNLIEAIKFVIKPNPKAK